MPSAVGEKLCRVSVPSLAAFSHPAGRPPGFSELIRQLCPPRATFPPPERFLKRGFALPTVAKSLVELDPGFPPPKELFSTVILGFVL